MYLNSNQQGDYQLLEQTAASNNSAESSMVDMTFADEKAAATMALKDIDLPLHSAHRPPRGLLSRWLQGSECRPPKVSHSVALDGFRGMATCLVFQAHLPGGHEAWGQAGLGAFFIFAGFLLVGTLEKLHLKAQASLSPATPRHTAWQRFKAAYSWIPEFQLARAARLMPAQLFMIGTTSYYMYTHSSGEWTGPFLTRAAIRAIFWSEDYSLEQSPYHQVWSLSFQEVSYLLMCFAMPFVPRSARGKWSFWATATAVMLSVSTLLTVSESVRFPFDGETYLGFPLLNLNWRRGVAGNIWKICFGAFIRTFPWPTWLYKQGRLGGFLAIFMVASVAWFNDTFINGTDKRDAVLGHNVVLFNPLMAIVTAAVILTSIEGNWFTEAAIFKFVAKCSYSAYLWHFTLSHITHWPNDIITGYGVLLMAIVCAYVSTVCVEEPILNAFKKWKGARK
ncbi:hypothetical protein BDZ90DRAFT_282278 [Jaminaea rosea]|uniref:Acyltransferase 3 domain-containing protein n=1 Tax=Jaminaea rosea TaxID=1569628 RepID=A0A316UHB9_9BASI|nr:hypothetical protein BDZ90DRAFT_282278 [Jaminaea rosea]PWN24639.1 hypothetical protein BDZ90DRAFT_282278 [Jaminaea rosea]